MPRMKPPVSRKSPLIIPKRVVEPANKLCLMAASYLTGDRPRFVYARLAHFFVKGANEQEPPFITPGFVGMKSGVIAAHGITSAWYSFDCSLHRSDGRIGASDNGKKRYQRFVTDLLAAGYSIEWQCPAGRYYGDRASLERALSPVPLAERYAS